MHPHHRDLQLFDLARSAAKNTAKTNIEANGRGRRHRCELAKGFRIQTSSGKTGVSRGLGAATDRGSTLALPRLLQKLTPWKNYTRLMFQNYRARETLKRHGADVQEISRHACTPYRDIDDCSSWLLAAKALLVIFSPALATGLNNFNARWGERSKRVECPT